MVATPYEIYTRGMPYSVWQNKTVNKKKKEVLTAKIIIFTK